MGERYTHIADSNVADGTKPQVPGGRRIRMRIIRRASGLILIGILLCLIVVHQRDARVTLNIRENAAAVAELLQDHYDKTSQIPWRIPEPDLPANLVKTGKLVYVGDDDLLYANSTAEPVIVVRSDEFDLLLEENCRGVVIKDGDTFVADVLSRTECNRRMAAQKKAVREHVSEELSAPPPLP